MKYSLNWLKELAPISWSVNELAERLTMAGIEVEGIQSQGAGFEKVVVAQVTKSEKHPNADRLTVCEVDTGSGKAQIVCGAKNYKVGDRVPLALPGAKLPCGIEIKQAKLRGVESQGMMCSPKELGLAEDAQGLMILSPDLKVGVPFAEAMGLNDTILDLEITPNRPDLLSHWGLARELAAIAGQPLLDPRRLLGEADEKHWRDDFPGAGKVPVRVEDPVRCPRYTARIIRGLRVGPSPEWLKRRLENLGQRSISNVVDITNFILLELGQPLHAFDLNLLEGPEIVVRLARDGEKIARLDGVASELKSSMLVIADRRRPVALAGVIGGSETAVSDVTRDVLLESAAFQPASIRKTSKALAVSTLSSYCFERGVDRELAGWASLRATKLLVEVCGGQVEGTLTDCRTQVSLPKAIRCRPCRVETLLGKSLPREEMEGILTRLGCRVSMADETLQVQPPSFRPDLEREIDLIEEIGRIHGVEKIPECMQPVAITTTRDSESFRLARELRQSLVAQGLDEAQTYTVLSSEALQKILPEPFMAPLMLANPLSSRMDVLRNSLLQGLLAVAAQNLETSGSAALFEIGKVFFSADGKTGERVALGIILAGSRRGGSSWEQGDVRKTCDYHDLKGVLDELLRCLKIQGVAERTAEAAEAVGLQPSLRLVLARGTQTLGFAGQVDPRLGHELKVGVPVFYAELDCAVLQQLRVGMTKYQPWTAFPSIRRDIAVVLATEEKHGRVEQTVVRLAKEFAEPKRIFLKNIELFDIFLSDKLGCGKKSLAYALTYQSNERTLTDSEINEVHEQIKKRLRNEIPCEIRE
jgi:phenylalanyl-tRNA synthetase beta chain